MKYFREYPWWLQALLFVLMVFVMISLAQVIILVVLPNRYGVTLDQIKGITENSPPRLIDAAITMQAIGSIFLFVISPLLFGYLAHPRPAQYLGLRRPGKSIQLLLSILLMISAIPVLAGIADLIGHIDFGAKVKAEQAANDNLTKAFLQIHDVPSLVRGLIVMGLIPAVGEELLFRGVLMRFARRLSRNMVMPVLFTAAAFAYSHTNIYGYLSIFLAGVLLAMIYYLTGSLWCSIAAHLFFNGSQVVMSYFASGNPAINQMANDKSVPLFLILGGLVVFLGAFLLLIKNKTPLPDDWANDFNTNEVRYADGE